MNKFQKGVASAVAAASILLNTALPVFAGTTIEISGNGAGSDNDANVNIDQVTTVVQTNQADFDNYVNADADTGKNDANYNTGGAVSVSTGNAAVGVGVTNTANSNVAEVDCCDGDVDVLIEGNGADSDNDANVRVNQHPDAGIFVVQHNSADIDNKVLADADTGKNDANYNTGGSVDVQTGHASTGVSIANSANANSAFVSGNSGGSLLSARILGNGAGSDNLINLNYDRVVLLDQSNRASIDNYVDADADTGKNDANYNTGGAVGIMTGSATVGVGIDNMANFNWADVDCGCLLDVVAKIAGNGAGHGNGHASSEGGGGGPSQNTINVNIDDVLAVAQENKCGTGWGWPFQLGSSGGRFPWFWKDKDCVENDVYADADTGKNDVNNNTGDPGVDPSIMTGSALNEVLIENTGNSNVFGEGPGPSWEPPFGGFSFNLNISFNLTDLLGALGLV